MSKKRNLKRTRNRYFMYLVALISVFIWSVIVASSHEIIGLELAVFRFINNWPNDLAAVFWGITQLGSVWAYMVYIVAAVAMQLYRLSLRIFCGGVVVYIITAIAKSFEIRSRPAYLLENVHIRDNMLGFGYPSGHTAVATVLALIILPYLPVKLRWLSFAAIGLVALSRIYLGVHSPLDVVGGFAIGATVVYGSMLVSNKLNAVTKLSQLVRSKW